MNIEELSNSKDRGKSNSPSRFLRSPLIIMALALLKCLIIFDLAKLFTWLLSPRVIFSGHKSFNIYPQHKRVITDSDSTMAPWFWGRADWA